MSRAYPFAIVLSLALLLPAAAAATTVHVITIDGGINPAVAAYVSKGIAQASGEGSDAVVLELDTPGGLLTSTKEIVNEVLNAPVPVIVYVSPRGAWAASAGTFITMSGHVAAMAPGTSIGAAHPVSIMPGVPQPVPPQMPGQEGDEDAKEREQTPQRDVMGEKIENFTAAFIESIAEARDRNVEWAIDAVRNSVAITDKTAVEKGVVDLVAEDLAHLLELVDGRTVTVGRNEVTLQTRGAQIVRIAMSGVDQFFNMISDPSIAFLLFLAGVGGLYLEFSNPGLIVPGVAGVICLILAGLAFQVIPFNWLGLILILAGVGLMISELFFATFGVLFAVGVVCLAVGGYLVFDVPEVSDFALPFWSVVLPTVLAFAVFGAIVVFGLSRTMFKPQFAGAESLVGKLAIADSDIDPRGRIFLHGDFWTAVAEEPISEGERVEIVEVDELLVRVARIPDSGRKV